jgi:hypothetical protein
MDRMDGGSKSKDCGRQAPERKMKTFCKSKLQLDQIFVFKGFVTTKAMADCN